MSDKTGGSAFPKQPRIIHPKVGETVMEQGGMSLRDYFAAAVVPSAIQALMAAGAADEASKRAARIAYEVADAMIQQRDKEPTC